MDTYVYKDQKWMKRGVTTGTCAAAAACAAAETLLSGDCPAQVTVATPSGASVSLEIQCLRVLENLAVCAVRKDAGDDPDVTDGARIMATVQRAESFSEDGMVWNPAGVKGNLRLFGGSGVGRVTKPGLSVAVGEAAVNPVPRQMIFDSVSAVCGQWNFAGTLSIGISVENGEELAQKTFNPHLGIVGGISILGTSGIVEPMSEKALTDTTRLELSMLAEEGARTVLLTPGNYGADYTKMNLEVDEKRVVKCSNFIGEALDDAVSLGFTGILLLGHIGKFVKLAAGIMNTHSKQADGRMEIFAAHTALWGGSRELIRQIMEAPTTDEILRLLSDAKLKDMVLDSVVEKMEMYVRRRVGEGPHLGVITFSNRYGLLGKAGEADELLRKLAKE